MTGLLCNLKLIRFTNKMTQSLRKYGTSNQEGKIKINGATINYLHTGNGSHSVLCYPGAMGTIWSDFTPQIENLDKTKLTVYAWDPPGYGHSRPPNKEFSLKFYEEDADVAHQLMQSLDVKSYSLLGWSDGGISSMILAAKYPSVIQKLVIWGANAYVIPKEIAAYEKIRDISKWSDRMKEPLIKLYGEKGLQDMWGSWCDTLSEISKRGGDICKEKLDLIQCPTLILHGEKDPMVASEHPDYLLQNIKGARIHRFPEGKHNVHLRYAEEFNFLVTKFLLE